MSNQYSVVFTNNAPEDGSVCIFQQQPHPTPGVMSLAWFAKYVNRGTSVTFMWNINYDFVWSQTGELKPGVYFLASQTLPADLSTSNEVTLNYNGGYRFTSQQRGPVPGTLTIAQDNTIPPNDAAVGIGMSGSGTFAIQAEPNITSMFTPHPQYWIAFGNFSQGLVLDIESITNPAEIRFPVSTYSMSITLNQDNTWTIESLHSANTRLARTRPKPFARSR